MDGEYKSSDFTSNPQNDGNEQNSAVVVSANGEHKEQSFDVDTESPTTNTTNRLTPELIMRAEFEVNEKDSWRVRDIEALREIILAETSLKCRMDDTFLLRFLRARRFDYDGAFQLICDYYNLYANNQELFVPIEKLKCLFDFNVMTIANGRSIRDETVFLLRLGKWNPRKFSFDDIIAASIMSMEMIIKDDVTQINGVVCAIDMAGFGWHQLRKFGPSQAKKVIHILDKCLPVRIKTIYVVNESTLADIGFAIMRPFMSEELHDKIIFCGSNFNTLHQNIAPEILPSEFGGHFSKICSQDWYKQLCQFEPEMNENFQEYGFVSNEPTNDTKCINICRGKYSESAYTGTDMKSLFRKSQTCNGYLFDYYNTASVD